MITIDGKSPTPPFEQIRAQLSQQIQAGTLHSGTRLPTVRRLAEDLGLAVNTVARAYRELESTGLVETRGRNGTVVIWTPSEAHRQIEAAAASFASRARDLGLPAREAHRIVQHALGLA